MMDRHQTSRHLLLTAILLLPIGAVAAAEFGRFVPERSRLTFVSKQMGVPIHGSFSRFTAQLSFDPAHPETGSATLDVDLTSIDAGSDDATVEVKRRTWFDTANFPSARFVSTSVRHLGGDRYEVAGRLTIKGRSRDLTAPATFRREGRLGVFEGGFNLRRTLFGLGEGPWADIETVADDVQVRFRITAAANR